MTSPAGGRRGLKMAVTRCSALSPRPLRCTDTQTLDLDPDCRAGLGSLRDLARVWGGGDEEARWEMHLGTAVTFVPLVCNYSLAPQALQESCSPSPQFLQTHTPSHPCRWNLSLVCGCAGVCPTF